MLPKVKDEIKTIDKFENYRLDNVCLYKLVFLLPKPSSKTLNANHYAHRHTKAIGNFIAKHLH